MTGNDRTMTPAEKREMGKLLFFRSESDAEEKKQGLASLIEASEKGGDPEASYLVARLILDDVLRVREGLVPEDCALRLMSQSARCGYLPAGTFLNAYCSRRYERRFAKKRSADGPLTDFEGKRIRIRRKGVFTPIDAILEYREGKNILTLRANVILLETDFEKRHSELAEAVLEGFRQWQGEYEVFGGQKLSVRVELTCEERTTDSVLVIPVDTQLENIILKTSDVLATKKRKGEIYSLFRSKRSFALQGLFSWRVNSAKTVYLQSHDGTFEDLDYFTAVAKHEFGHLLGLGDLYSCEEDALEGVEKGNFAELDSYSLGGKFYHLVMCDANGPVSNNDMEMVVLAFWKNRAQNYQKRNNKGRISAALGKGN